jgi:hypothetical protein
MRVAAERRADGVYVAAGVELIEPETRHESTRGGWVEPSRVTRLGDRLRWQTAKRLREAIGHRDVSVGLYHRTPVLKACHCSTVFVGDPAHAIARPASARPTFSLPAPLSGASVRSSDSPLSPYSAASAARR